MAKFRSVGFKDVRQELDGNEFLDCTFENAELVFGARGPVGLSGCQFINCRWTFDGPAADTLSFLSALYRGGARDLVESTFMNIKTGALSKKPSR